MRKKQGKRGAHQSLYIQRLNNTSSTGFHMSSFESKLNLISAPHKLKHIKAIVHHQQLKATFIETTCTSFSVRFFCCWFWRQVCYNQFSPVCQQQIQLFASTCESEGRRKQWSAKGLPDLCQSIRTNRPQKASKNTWNNLGNQQK